jgi:RimJ/RimL family protein N-acetyltransferase
LNVLETNRRARGVYERVGFAPESLRYVKWLP